MISPSRPERVLISYEAPRQDALIKVGVAVVADNYEFAGQLYDPRNLDGRWRASRLIIETIAGSSFIVVAPDYRSAAHTSQIASVLDVTSSIVAKQPRVTNLGTEFPPIVIGQSWSALPSTKLVSKLLVVAPSSYHVLEPNFEPSEEYDITEQLLRHKLTEVFNKSPEALIQLAKQAGGLATIGKPSLES